MVAARDRVLAATGGAPGLRDAGLLDSAPHRPRARFGGHPLYPDLVSKAAPLLHALVAHHPFVDGNKRTAVVVALALLERGGLALDADDATLEEAVVALAQHRGAPADVREWLRRDVCPTR